jgi:hypothetical protein
MELDSMEEKLLSLIEQLKSDRRLDSFDEAATKQIVLLRILSLLDWDIYNIDEVMPEYSVGSQRVDYALRHSKTNKVFIEVKKIGEDLEKHQQQLLSYSFQEGVKLSILTNGISWQFYLPLHEGSWEQRKFYTVDVYDQNSRDIVRRFIDYLAKENVYSGKSIQNAEDACISRQKEHLISDTLPKAWDKLISEPDEKLFELIADATEKLCGYRPGNLIVEKFISSNITGARVSIETRRAKEPVKKATLTNGESYIGKSVTAFLFKTKRYEVKYWIEVLSQICKLMYNLHRSNFEMVLQLRGSKRPYFTRNADELRIPQQVEDSRIFMETNLSSSSIVKLALKVISLFGYSENDFRIEAH